MHDTISSNQDDKVKVLQIDYGSYRYNSNKTTLLNI